MTEGDSPGAPPAPFTSAGSIEVDSSSTAPIGSAATGPSGTSDGSPSQQTGPAQPYPWADAPTRIANLEFQLAQLTENVKATLRNHEAHLAELESSKAVLAKRVEGLELDLKSLNIGTEQLLGVIARNQITMLFGGTPASYTARLEQVEHAVKQFDLGAATKVEKPVVWRRPVAAQANPAWCLAPGTEFDTTKTIGQQDVSNMDEFKLRAQFGYRPDGTRALAGADLIDAYAKCDALVRTTNPEEADKVCMGAGNLPWDVAIARILLGLTAGGKYGTTPLMAALKHYPEKSMDELLKGVIA